MRTWMTAAVVTAGLGLVGCDQAEDAARQAGSALEQLSQQAGQIAGEATKAAGQVVQKAEAAANQAWQGLRTEAADRGAAALGQAQKTITALADKAAQATGAEKASIEAAVASLREQATKAEGLLTNLRAAAGDQWQAIARELGTTITGLTERTAAAAQQFGLGG